MAHKAVQFLSKEQLEMRDRVELALLKLESVVFAGVSLLPVGNDLVAKVTVGSDNLAIGKAQIANIVPLLESNGLDNAEVVLTRGRGQG